MKKIILTTFIAFCCSIMLGQSQAVQFSGTNSSIDIGNTIGNGVRTVELWFRPSVNINPSTTDDAYSLVVRNDGEIGEYGMYIKGGHWPPSEVGYLGFFIRDNGLLREVYSNSNTWSTNTWYHVAVTIDAAAGMNLYVNGSLQSTNIVQKNPTMTKPEITAFGTWGNANVPRRFKGDIDEVKFWNRALTQTEIQDKRCTIINPANETGLVGYWQFEEGTGTITNELVNNINNTLTNVSWIGSNNCLSPTILITSNDVDNTICNGNSISFNATTTNAGTSPVYQWQVNGTNVGTNQSSYTTSNLQSGDAVACILNPGANSVTSNVVATTVNQLPDIAISASTNTYVCAGTNITLSANGGVYYTWGNNATTQNINVTPQSNTIYIVTGTDANGCTNNASIAIRTSTACVNILPSYCGITINNLLDHKMFSTHNLPNVQSYIFTFTPINTTNSITFISNTYWMNLPLTGALTYNTTYSVTVQVLFNNGSYSPVSPSCLFTIGPPSTQIQTGKVNYCGITVNNLDGRMFANAVGIASNYLFTFLPVGGGTASTFNSSTNWIDLSSLTPNLSFNTSYSVTVQATATGVTGSISPVCMFHVGLPQTSIALNYCNITVNNLNGSMFANYIGYSTNYLFTFTPPANSGLPTSYFNSPTKNMSLSSAVPTLTNNTTYNVTVQVTAAGVIGNVSQPCSFTIGNPIGRFMNPNKISSDEPIHNTGLAIFPNPTKDKINITLSNVSDKKCTIEMYDLFGKLIYKNEVLNTTGLKFNTEIDITNFNLSNGLYLINVNSDNQKSSQRVVIEK